MRESSLLILDGVYPNHHFFQLVQVWLVSAMWGVCGVFFQKVGSWLRLKLYSRPNAMEGGTLTTWSNLVQDSRQCWCPRGQPGVRLKWTLCLRKVGFWRICDIHVEFAALLKTVFLDSLDQILAVFVTTTFYAEFIERFPTSVPRDFHVCWRRSRNVFMFFL